MTLQDIIENIDKSSSEDMKDEVRQVKELGDKIGYGHMMELASALWRKNLKDKGYPTSGAFITTLLPFIDDKETKEMAERTMNQYDKIIEL